MYGCESWAIKKAECRRIDVWTVVLDKTLESPLDCKEIQPIHLKGNQSWIFIGRTDAEAEIPILWPPDVNSWLIWKDPDAGGDWGQEEKGMTEDEMVGWHHWLNGHGFGGTPGVGDGQGGLQLQFMGSQRVGHDWVTELNWVSHKDCFQSFMAQTQYFFCFRNAFFKVSSLFVLQRLSEISWDLPGSPAHISKNSLSGGILTS